ncbi:AAA family ATPase, partial [bacterium]|nr:AAA family ATPase [bacterium]
MTLFDKSELVSDLENESLPLAARLRPQSISEMVGQSRLISENGAIARMVRTRHLHSFILWGPPGCGKTTLARAL